MSVHTNIPSERFLLRPFVAAPVGGRVPTLSTARSADSAAAAAPCHNIHKNITPARLSVQNTDEHKVGRPNSRVHGWPVADVSRV